jgi:hypothetical protein
MTMSIAELYKGMMDEDEYGGYYRPLYHLEMRARFKAHKYAIMELQKVNESGAILVERPYHDNSPLHNFDPKRMVFCEY